MQLKCFWWHTFYTLPDRSIYTEDLTQNATDCWIVQLGDETAVQVAPEERRPVTEDGEAASTHEPVRALEEEVCTSVVCTKRFLTPIPCHYV